MRHEDARAGDVSITVPRAHIFTDVKVNQPACASALEAVTVTAVPDLQAGSKEDRNITSLCFNKGNLS